MTKISVIIPVLNEAETISDLLNHLSNSSSKGNIAEIIVVDGGSTDESKDVISKFKEVILLSSKKGRAVQMNIGANQAKGDILYFLHADSYPPKNFDELIINEVEKGNIAGCFKMKFKSNHWWLKLAGWLTQFKWRACRGGDQSQFISKQLFIELNGFNEEFIIYEDNDLINKLYARNQFVVIQEWIVTSARKYETNGIWKLQYHFWAIYIKKWLGASPKVLHQYYLKNIR
ncbi:MAG: glycosyltransferase [Flavobacteriaceae bacterium]|nr:TIGR04283 family arsenosugar biosynthesis glycosyltransferase [Bacteroidia bacterium]NNL15915.1 glycosyltransferase [Flavobacteriaceae bacterium]